MCVCISEISTNEKRDYEIEREQGDIWDSLEVGKGDRLGWGGVPGYSLMV